MARVSINDHPSLSESLSCPGLDSNQRPSPCKAMLYQLSYPNVIFLAQALCFSQRPRASQTKVHLCGPACSHIHDYALKSDLISQHHACILIFSGAFYTRRRKIQHQDVRTNQMPNNSIKVCYESKYDMYDATEIINEVAAQYCNKGTSGSSLI